MRSCCAALVAVALAASCLDGGTGRPAGSQCSADVECGSGLRCLYGRCRGECSFDRDCPEGTVCGDVGGDPPQRACTLPASSGPLRLGEVCAEGGECEPDLVCTLLTLDDRRLCVEPCSDGDPSCGTEVDGSVCAQESGGGATFCTVDCDPISGEPCGGGLHCTLIFEYEWIIFYSVLTHCTNERGEGGQDAPCESKADCQVGFTCDDAGVCHRICEVPGGEGCPEGTSCASFAPEAWIGDRQYGACRP